MEDKQDSNPVSENALAELADQVLTQGQSLRIRARGFSMQPYIRDGDILVIVPCRISSVRRGQILLFRNSSGNLLVHRVVKCLNLAGAPALKMQGDANRYADEIIYAPQVLGRLVVLERNGKTHRLDTRWHEVRVFLWMIWLQFRNFLYQVLDRSGLRR